MSERKAGMIANKIYAGVDSKQITPREALKMLDKIGHMFSTTQYYKHLDFIRYYDANPHLLDV